MSDDTFILTENDETVKSAENKFSDILNGRYKRILQESLEKERILEEERKAQVQRENIARVRRFEDHQRDAAERDRLFLQLAKKDFLRENDRIALRAMDGRPAEQAEYLRDRLDQEQAKRELPKQDKGVMFFYQYANGSWVAGSLVE